MEKLHLAIIGVGLIGGSFGLAVKDQLRDKVHITGLFRSRASLEAALSCGAVDEASVEVADVVKNADVVYLSTPVLQMVPMVEAMRPFLKRGAIVTDAGSTKEYLWKEIPPRLPTGVGYVSGHPMTGKEKSGVRAADKTLFRHRCYVLMEETTASPEEYERVADLIRLTGANLTTLDVKRHDRCASMISHVPHVTAAALVTLLEKSGGDLAPALKLAGGGFKDTTRIASSNADMWADICLTNPKAISEHLRRLTGILGEVACAVEAGDRGALHAYFSAAKERRDRILDETGKLFDI